MGCACKCKMQVLWPDSGWKPVPLVDIIEGNSVKRAYQKALLCLHPDKLQQKGAASHQKYIAEKVFDSLQVTKILFHTFYHIPLLFIASSLTSCITGGLELF